MIRVYYWSTVVFLAIFALGCASNTLNKTAVNVSKTSANGDEKTVLTSKENTNKKLAENGEQNASRDIEYSPASPEDPGSVQGQAAFIAGIRYANIPLWVRQIFFDKGLNKRYSFYFRDIRPLYLRGDFNGDRKTDIAVMLKDKTHKDSFPISVMAIFHGGTQQVIVIDDPNKLGADDVWMVVSKEETPEYARIPSLGKEEGILMAKAMSASRLIYWDGKQYRSAQTSD